MHEVFVVKAVLKSDSLKMQGLTPAGYLRAVDDDSETYELHPDGNRYEPTLIGCQVSILS